MNGRIHRAAILALFLLPVLLAGCGKPPEKDAQSQTVAFPITVQSVIVKDVKREIPVVGTLYGDEDVTIAAKVPGKITGIFKDVGDTVESDQPMAQIEKIDYELAVRQKELSIQQSLASIGLKDIPNDAYDPETTPTVVRARLQAENSQARFNRGKQLFELDPPRISAQDYDDLKSTLAVAQQEYQVQKLTALAVVSEARSRQADLAIQQQKLQDSTIKAPIVAMDPSNQGTAPRRRTYAVTDRMISVGEYVKEGASLFHLVDSDIIKLRASAPERYTETIRIGQKVAFNIEADNDEFIGTITRINPQIDVANRTFQIEATVSNKDHRLKPGSFVRARVSTHTQPNVVFVPLVSVISYAGVNKVFTVVDGKAQEILVDLGNRDGNWVEIQKGLAPGDTVVVDGNTKLANGMPVSIKAAPDAIWATQDAPAPSSQPASTQQGGVK